MTQKRIAPKIPKKLTPLKKRSPSKSSLLRQEDGTRPRNSRALDDYVDGPPAKR